MVKWDKIPDVDQPWMEFWPKETPRNLDYEEIPLDEILKRNAKDIPESDAIYFEGYRITNRELDYMVDQFATGLSKLGIKEKDVVLIDMPNIPQFVIAFYAILRVGAIANPIIPLNHYAEIVYQANDSKAKALIILDFLYEEMLEGKDLSKLKTLETIIMTGLGEYLSPIKRVLGTMLGKVPRMKNWPNQIGDINFLKFQDVLKDGLPISLPERHVNPREDTAVLIYTGGTTGSPKGVMTTHFNLLANCIQGYTIASTQLPELLKMRGKGGLLIVLPLAHSFALSIGMNIGLWFGYKLILFPQPPTPISNLLKVIVKENATFAPGVPTLWNKINQDPKSTSYKPLLAKSNFAACVSGAAPLPLEVRLKFEELTGAQLVEGYGMSEASPILTVNPFKRGIENTVGLPVSDTYIKVMDAEKGVKNLGHCPHSGAYCMEKCGEDDEGIKYVGEICACGPQIMPGYLNRPVDTEYALRKDEKGVNWYYTADIGCMDSEGYLHIKDRKRDMIKYKAHSVFPREVEDLMYQYEPILEVGVYGAPSSDPEIGEEIKAVVSLKPEYIGKITVEDIQNWVKENIAPYKYPREIKIAKELPKSLVGKVLRRVLREGEEGVKSQ